MIQLIPTKTIFVKVPTWRYVTISCFSLLLWSNSLHHDVSMFSVFIGFFKSLYVFIIAVNDVHPCVSSHPLSMCSVLICKFLLSISIVKFLCPGLFQSMLNVWCFNSFRPMSWTTSKFSSAWLPKRHDISWSTVYILKIRKYSFSLIGRYTTKSAFPLPSLTFWSEFSFLSYNFLHSLASRVSLIISKLFFVITIFAASEPIMGWNLFFALSNHSYDSYKNNFRAGTNMAIRPYFMFSLLLWCNSFHQDVSLVSVFIGFFKSLNVFIIAVNDFHPYVFPSSIYL